MGLASKVRAVALSIRGPISSRIFIFIATEFAKMLALVSRSFSSSMCKWVSFLCLRESLMKSSIDRFCSWASRARRIPQASVLDIRFSAAISVALARCFLLRSLSYCIGLDSSLAYSGCRFNRPSSNSGSLERGTAWPIAVSIACLTTPGDSIGRFPGRMIVCALSFASLTCESLPPGTT